MKFRNLSFRTQIFLASLLLVTIPVIVIGIIAANRNASVLVSDYNQSMETIIIQADLTLDTLLSDATKIADMPLLNQDIRKAMLTDYSDDYLAFSRDYAKFKDQFIQTNRLNQNLVTCVFQNRYGFTFEYNISNVAQQIQITQTLEELAQTARASANYTYFAPLRTAGAGPQKNVLPMVKVLFDAYDFKELGICYAEINFQSVQNIMDSARNRDNTLFIYNADGGLSYSSNPRYITDPSSHAALLDALSDFNSTLNKNNRTRFQTLRLNGSSYMVNGCHNETTGWHLVQFVDNQMVTNIYRSNFFSYSGIFALSLVLGLVLAYILSRTLTRPVSRLCREIDSCPPQSCNSITIENCGSNQELRKLVTSFNNLNRRLSDSMEQNYQIRLEEQQSRIQMLQFQINHHFLYNTLNVIKSLAALNNIPEIETVAVCMSDLIRYNLTKFPIALLKEEAAQIHRYMTIQNIRFPGKFLFDVSIPEALLELQIPAFILQPLVENCIEHGFRIKEQQCYIGVSCNLENSRIHFYIADNGDGIGKDTLKQITDSLENGNTLKRQHCSIGIHNVHQRIQSYYGRQYGLSLESSPGEGTIIDICLPYPPPVLSEKSTCSDPVRQDK